MEKRHVIQEYDLLIGEDRHTLSPEIEQQFLDLGFKQVVMPCTVQCTPVDGCNFMGYDYFTGEFRSDKYVALYLDSQEKLLIWNKEKFVGYATIDDGKPYTLEQGLIRLKELLNGSNN